MAHGSKKWIIAYDGKIKRSNGRTKDDWYRDLRWWEPMETKAWRGSRRTKTFCPQCKHVAKTRPDDSDIDAQWAVLRKKYDAIYQPIEEARRTMLLAEVLSIRWWKANRVVRKGPEYIDFHQFVEREGCPPQKWVYHWDTFLCYPCERKSKLKDDRWRKPYPGKRRGRTFTRKSQYNWYRQAMKQALRQEDYEAMRPYTKGWLD